MLYKAYNDIQTPKGITVTIKNFTIQTAIAFVAFFALGFVLKIIPIIKKNREYKKACAQIGWTPKFERRPLFNRK